MKSADDLVLLAKEEMILQCMTNRQSEVGRCYGMEMNPEKKKSMQIPSPAQIMTDQKEMENVEYFDYPGDVITNDARSTHKIKSSITLAKAAFNKKNLFTRKSDLNLRKNPEKCYTWSIALCGPETWYTSESTSEIPQSFEMWYCRRIEMISWTDYVKNEEVLQTVKEERNILHITQGRQAN